MDKETEQIANILEQFDSLPIKCKTAFSWLIENIEMVDLLCSGEKLIEKEIEEMTKHAIETEDYLLLVLIKYKQSKDRYST